MANNMTEERFCLLCGNKLSGFNKNDICFCHEVIPGSASDIELKQKRLQAYHKKKQKKAT